MNVQDQKLIAEFRIKYGNASIDEFIKVLKKPSAPLEIDESVCSLLKLMTCPDYLYYDKWYSWKVKNEGNIYGWYCEEWFKNTRTYFGENRNSEKLLRKRLGGKKWNPLYFGVFSPWLSSDIVDLAENIFIYFNQNDSAMTRKIYEEFFGRRKPIKTRPLKFDPSVEYTPEMYYFTIIFLNAIITNNTIEDYYEKNRYDLNFNSLCKQATGISSLERAREIVLKDQRNVDKFPRLKCFIMLELKANIDMSDFKRPKNIRNGNYINRETLVSIYKVLWRNRDDLDSFDSRSVLEETIKTGDVSSPVFKEFLNKALEYDSFYTMFIEELDNKKEGTTLFRNPVEKEFLTPHTVSNLVSETIHKDLIKNDPYITDLYVKYLFKKDVVVVPLLAYIYSFLKATKKDLNILVNFLDYTDLNDVLVNMQRYEEFSVLFDFKFLPKVVSEKYDYLQVYNTINNFFGLNLYRRPSSASINSKYMFRWSPAYGNLNDSWVSERNKGAQNFYNKLNTRAETRGVHIYTYAYINLLGELYIDEATGGRLGQLHKEYFNYVKDLEILTAKEVEQIIEMKSKLIGQEDLNNKYVPALCRNESAYTLDNLELFALEIVYILQEFQKTSEGRRFKYTRVRNTAGVIDDAVSMLGMSDASMGMFADAMLGTGDFKNAFKRPDIPSWLEEEINLQKEARARVLKYLKDNFGYNGDYHSIITVGIKACKKELETLISIESAGQMMSEPSNVYLVNFLDHLLVNLDKDNYGLYFEYAKRIVNAVSSRQEEMKELVEKTNSILNKVYQESMDYSKTNETDYVLEYMELLKRDLFTNADTSSLDAFFKSIEPYMETQKIGNVKCLYFRKLFTPEYAKSMKHIVDCYKKFGFVPRAVIKDACNPNVIEWITSEDYITNFKDSRNNEQILQDFLVTLNRGVEKSGMTQKELNDYYESILGKYYSDPYEMMRFISYAM